MSLYETLRQDLLSGRFEPGTKLKMDALKQQYQSGVNVLRESLVRLSAEGLVEAEDQKGFRVIDTSPERLDELTRLRILLECDGARQSFVNGGVEWESNLVAAHHKLSYLESKMQINENEHFSSWHQADYDFHAALISACNSDLHKHYHRQIYDQFRQFVVVELKTTGFRGHDIVNEHKAIMDAALERNAEACAEALKAHLGEFVRRLEQNSKNYEKISPQGVKVFDFHSKQRNKREQV